LQTFAGWRQHRKERVQAPAKWKLQSRNELAISSIGSDFLQSVNVNYHCFQWPCSVCCWMYAPRRIRVLLPTKRVDVLG